jgi:hypothetical protein
VILSYFRFVVSCLSALMIAYDVICSKGSANPSMNGLHNSFENLTYQFHDDKSKYKECCWFAFSLTRFY